MGWPTPARVPPSETRARARRALLARSPLSLVKAVGEEPFPPASTARYESPVVIARPRRPLEGANHAQNLRAPALASALGSRTCLPTCVVAFFASSPLWAVGCGLWLWPHRSGGGGRGEQRPAGDCAFRGLVWSGLRSRGAAAQRLAGSPRTPCGGLGVR